MHAMFVSTIREFALDLIQQGCQSQCHWRASIFVHCRDRSCHYLHLFVQIDLNLRQVFAAQGLEEKVH